MEEIDDDRRPPFRGNIERELQEANAGPELTAFLGERWGRCDFTAHCQHRIHELTESAAQRVVEALPEGAHSGSLRVVSGFLWFCESAATGDVPVLREAVRSFCSACFENGPKGDNWRTMVGEEARRVIGAPEGKLKFTPSIDEAGVPSLTVELVGLPAEPGKLTIAATEETVSKLDQFVSQQAIASLAALLADRALGHIGGPLTAVPHSAHQNVLTGDLSTWNAVFAAFNKETD